MRGHDPTRAAPPSTPPSWVMDPPPPAVPPEVQAASILAASFDRIAAALEKLAEAVATRGTEG